MLHQGLTKEKWQELPFFNQMANIGAEIGRAINWKEKDKNKSLNAFEWGLELLDLTIEDKKNNDGKLKELCLLREVLIDYFYFDNIYGSTDEKWNEYFYGFNYASAVAKGF
ncbi:MAG: hypothetical protein AAB890_02905 [Patescibacteria group bacterium]